MGSRRERRHCHTGLGGRREGERERGLTCGIWPELIFLFGFSLFFYKSGITELEKNEIKYWAVGFEVRKNFDYCNFL
jgi:hypothetical protein